MQPINLEAGEEDYSEGEDIPDVAEIKESRFDVSKISPLDYMFFDKQNPDLPLVYWLFLVKVENKWCNWQVVLGCFDPSVKTKSPQLDRELWSTHLYTDFDGLLNVGPRIISLLEHLDLNYPVELTYTFGGYAYPPPFPRKNIGGIAPNP